MAAADNCSDAGAAALAPLCIGNAVAAVGVLHGLAEASANGLWQRWLFGSWRIRSGRDCCSGLFPTWPNRGIVKHNARVLIYNSIMPRVGINAV